MNRASKKADPKSNNLTKRINVFVIYNDEDPEMTPERWWSRRQAQNLNFPCQ